MNTEYRCYIPKLGDYELFRNTIIATKPEGLEKERGFLQGFIDTPINTDPVLVKARVQWLSAYYSTRISKKGIDSEQDKIVKIITMPGFDAKLDQKSHRLVDELVYDMEKSGTKRHFSFASKYCHHCRPNIYPIYDRLNMCVMNIFCGYKFDSKDYEGFVKCYKMFYNEFIEGYCQKNELDAYEGLYIDKYIQAIGSDSESELRKLLP